MVTPLLFRWQCAGPRPRMVKTAPLATFGIEHGLSSPANRSGAAAPHLPTSLSLPVFFLHHAMADPFRLASTPSSRRELGMSDRRLFFLTLFVLLGIISVLTVTVVLPGADSGPDPFVVELEEGEPAPADVFPPPEEGSINPHTPSEPEVRNIPVVDPDIELEGQESGVGPILDGTSAVLLVASADCPHCQDLLAEIAERAADGEALHRLRVITLEGVDEGRSLLDDVGLAELEAWAPHDDLEVFLSGLDVDGTPTLLYVNDEGRLLDRVLGALGDAELDGWIDRMREG